MQHEDSWLFTIAYVALAVALSMFVSLFWLVVLVVVHFGLEFVALEAQHPPLARRAAGALWAVKLDVALLAFALVLSLYLDALFGLLGLRSAAHVATATRAAGRFATLERTIRGILLSIDDAVYVARAFAKRTPKGQRKAELAARHREDAAHAASRARRARVLRQSRIGTGDWIAMALLAACVALAVAAPWLAGLDYAEVAGRLRDEMRPFH